MFCLPVWHIPHAPQSPQFLSFSLFFFVKIPFAIEKPNIATYVSLVWTGSEWMDQIGCKCLQNYWTFQSKRGGKWHSTLCQDFQYEGYLFPLHSTPLHSSALLRKSQGMQWHCNVIKFSFSGILWFLQKWVVVVDGGLVGVSWLNS